jgi:uncharacterized membrane protein
MNLTLYSTFKALHVLGVVLLLGNAIATAVWKVMADRTREPSVVAFAQRLVTLTDWSLTAGGIALIVLGGYGAAHVGELPLFGPRWLVWGQVLFAVSALLWMFVLLPAQIRQARQARAFARGGEIPESYRHDARRWLFWGIVATVPLIVAVWVMVVKPGN